MAIRRSTALINKLAQGYGVRELLRDGRIYLYTGTQPTSVDSLPTGTNICIFTAAGGTFTPPVQSRAKITLSGVSGSLDTVKVGGMAFNLLSAAVSYDTSLTATAAAVAANINAQQNPLNITADSSSADVRLYLPYWLGALGDGLTLAVTATTLGAAINGGSSATFGGSGSPGGGTTAVNGLNFNEAISAGALSKTATAWQGIGINGGGVAGWFRFVAGGSDIATAGTSSVYFDGSVGTSSTTSDMAVSSLTITADAVYTISNGTTTEPTSDEA